MSNAESDTAGAVHSHRLDGLEPDNLLAFLALLGLLRALEAADRDVADEQKLRPRAAWDLDDAPLRPTLHVRRGMTRIEIADAAARGLSALAPDHQFDDRADLNHTRKEARELLETTASAASWDQRRRADLLAALMSDGAVKDGKDAGAAPVDPTPLCLLFGQGHQHFLDRLAKVPAQAAPPPGGRGKSKTALSAGACLAEALFAPWHRDDPTFSFRWDPDEDVRYALMAGDPTDAAYKSGTQHGANRLAAVGIVALTVAPQTRAGRARPAVIGGASGPDGFSFAWPIWGTPASLAAIRALLGHPQLRTVGALAHLGVAEVLQTRRISVGKFMNFTRARPIFAQEAGA